MKHIIKFEPTKHHGDMVRVSIEWKLVDGNFSMMGVVDRLANGRWLDDCGGQCQDTIAEIMGHDPLAVRMIEVWNRWHLNDMRAGCEHQRAEKWAERPIYADKPAKTYVKHPDGTMGWNMLTWQPVEQGGLLSAPCPTCGFKYGTKWLREPLPADITAEIEAWSSDPRATVAKEGKLASV